MPRTIGALALLFALVACGGDGESTAEPESQTNLPACADQWVEGETVTDAYANGCMETSKSFVVAFTQDCASGGRFIHTPFGYGIVGQQVHLTAPGDDEPDVNSAEYKQVQADCQAAS